MAIRISGAGIAGMSAAFFFENREITIYERLTENEWREYFSRSVVIKAEHLERICLISYELGEIIKECSRKIFGVTKIYPSGKKYNFNLKKPIFYAVSLYEGNGNGILEKMRSSLEDRDSAISFGNEGIPETSDLWATGSIHNNIMGYGGFVGSETDRIILYYNDQFSPKGYTYLCPEAKTGEALLLAVCFDNVNQICMKKEMLLKCLLKDPNISPYINGKKVRRITVFSNYGYPIRRKEGNAITAGESGLYMDPLRGFGAYYAIISAAAAARRLSGNPDVNLEKELDDEIRNKNDTRKQLLHAMDESHLEERIMKTEGRGYISASEEIHKLQ